MKKELDKLVAVLPTFNLLEWKFSNDREHDKKLLEWFADGGELRGYKDYKITGAPWRYNVTLYKKGLTKHLGIISSDFLDAYRDGNLTFRTRYQYVAFFRKLNTNLSYCTNNLLKTVEEIQNAPNISKFTNDTIYYSDGSYSKGNIFHLSKDTVKTFQKSKNELTSLLDDISNNIIIEIL